MAWWIYKCNSKHEKHQVAWGDWDDFFQRAEESGDGIGQFGRTDYSPSLKELRRGDFILAYQTNRNELVGLLQFNRFEEREDHDAVLLEQLSPKTAVKVRPLKKANKEIAGIPALQPGQIKTIYPISKDHALKLLKAAGINHPVDKQVTRRQELNR